MTDAIKIILALKDEIKILEKMTDNINKRIENIEKGIMLEIKEINLKLDTLTNFVTMMENIRFSEK